MTSSRLRIERWGNDYHGTATIGGCTYIVESPSGDIAFPSIQSVIDAAHTSFPRTLFELDFEIMAPSPLFLGLRNALIVTLFAYLLVASIAGWWPFP